MSVQLARRLFTVDDFYRMAEAGILHEDDRVELIEGEVVEMPPIGSHHAAVVDNLTSLFARGTRPDEAIVRIQGPVRLGDRSELLPDIALLRPQSYAERHPLPADVMLLVEVADSSLVSDQRVKVPLYAGYGIPEVWLVNVTNNTIEVYREPSGQAYRSLQVAGPGDRLTPLALPNLTLAVDDILDRRP